MALLVEPLALQAEVQALAGEQQHERAASASSAAETDSVLRTPQRYAASTASPSSSAGDARLREARHEPGEQPRQHGRADLHLAAGAPHSTTVVTAIITSARKRP